MELHGENFTNNFEVLLRKQPEKYLRKLDNKSKNLFQKTWEELEINPFKIAHPLHGQLEGLYKVRVGSRRIILLIDRNKRIIDVLEIGPRGDIYK